jgi:nitroreductase
MSAIEIIKKRYSCRNYLQKPIEQEKLDKIFQIARLAPSAKNLQDWRFIVINDPAKKKQIAACTNRCEIFEKAGAIIVACSDSDYVMKCGQPCGPIDVSIALDHITLIATELGLATCWIGSFETDTVRKIAAIPQDVTIVQLMAIGYPADQGSQPEKLPAEKIVSYNKWDFPRAPKA